MRDRMIIDESGNLIVGTEPGGLILRVTPTGQSFVLYQANKREVTAVAEHDGLIYAAAIGSKPGGLSVSGAPPVLPAAPSAPVSGAGSPRSGSQPPSLAPCHWFSDRYGQRRVRALPHPERRLCRAGLELAN